MPVLCVISVSAEESACEGHTVGTLVCSVIR